MPKNLEISFLMDFYGEMLTEKQREVMEYYYDDDLSLGEIAANEGITRQGVRDSIKRAEAQLLEMEQRLKLAQKFRNVQQGLDHISRAALRIQQCNRDSVCSREIEKEIDIILNAVEGLSD